MKLRCKMFGHKWETYLVGKHWMNPPHNEVVRVCVRCREREIIGFDYDV